MKRLIAALIALLPVVALAADQSAQVTASDGTVYNFVLSLDKPCENPMVQMVLSMNGVDLSKARAGSVKESKGRYEAEGCYVRIDKETVLFVDENGNGGGVPAQETVSI